LDEDRLNRKEGYDKSVFGCIDLEKKTLQGFQPNDTGRDLTWGSVVWIQAFLGLLQVCVGMKITGYNDKKVVVENKVVTIRSLGIIYSAFLFGFVVFVAMK